ncbi:hypothetical protein R5W24_003373 [Gemmata sp. JC717]|uniref:hypothetical protein n=1 Tax=Gemmata algarum TaxID=2975278 RepID=UPI0021BB4DC8|nr:hypothetical protein [Gemmata algarum]MDY3554254.1 hypothetical protein [Gemmata algarum]
MTDFTNWSPFEFEPETSGAAVYEFRIVVGGTPLTLGRMLSSDPSGVLVIGCTGNMYRRWCQSQTARSKCYGSSTLNLLYYLEHYSPLPERHPTAVYEYRYAVAESPVQAKVWEERLLKRYFRTFGELPPLNSTLPKRYGNYEDPDFGTGTG